MRSIMKKVKKDNSGLVILGLLVLIAFILLKSKSQSISNEEVWRWTDWRGRQREIVAFRKVQAQ